MGSSSQIDAVHAVHADGGAPPCAAQRPGRAILEG